MRISDWSSDVCSSDLERRDVGVEPDAEAVLQDPRARFLVDEGAAAGREYHRLSGEQARANAAPAVAAMSLAEARETVGNRNGGGAVDLVVGGVGRGWGREGRGQKEEDSVGGGNK